MMKPFRFRYDHFELQYDRDHGVDHRSGWSVVIDGKVYVQFERGPVRAVWRAVREWRRSEVDELQHR